MFHVLPEKNRNKILDPNHEISLEASIQFFDAQDSSNANFNLTDATVQWLQHFLRLTDRERHTVTKVHERCTHTCWKARSRRGLVSSSRYQAGLLSPFLKFQLYRFQGWNDVRGRSTNRRPNSTGFLSVRDKFQAIFVRSSHDIRIHP